MTATSLSNDSGETLFVGMSDAHSIVPTAADAPRDKLVSLDPVLLISPIENTVPQTIRARRVVRISGTVSSTRNLDPDRCPASRDVVAGRARVFGSVTVQAVDCHDCREPTTRL